MAKSAVNSSRVSPNPVERIKRPVHQDEDIVVVRLRMPHCLHVQLKECAQAKGLSMNAMAAVFIDEGLGRGSLKGIDDLAPEYWSYLAGNRRHK